MHPVENAYPVKLEEASAIRRPNIRPNQVKNLKSKKIENREEKKVTRPNVEGQPTKVKRQRSTDKGQPTKVKGQRSTW